jgi:hypothetical protein
MTTATAHGYNLGLTYGTNSWMAWTQRGSDETTFRAHIGQTRELATKRAQERTSAAVGEALRGLEIGGVWIAEGFEEPPRLPVKAIPKMCRGALKSPQEFAASKNRARLPAGTPRGPAARSTEIDVGSVWACYTVVRFVREAKSMDGRDNPVLAVRPSCCGREVEMHRKSLVGIKNADAKCCAQCGRERRMDAQRERRKKAEGKGS